MNKRPSFCDPGVGEAVKCAVHGAALTIVTAEAVYNVAAYQQRRDPRLAFNIVVLIVFWAWEMRQVVCHARA